MEDDHTLEFLLAFHGRIHRLEGGYFIKFEIKRADVRSERPHGLNYAFTLHGPDGQRLMGFDNAHTVRRSGYRKTMNVADHWHRTETDPGRPYRFVDAEQLIVDFFAEVRRVLEDRGIDDNVIGVESKGEDL